MSSSISLTQTQIFSAVVAALGSFGLQSSVAGQTVPVYRGQVNRVPEPLQSDFVIIWPISRVRLAMNIDTNLDNQVSGSITGNILIVSAVILGSVSYGQVIYGDGVTVGTTVGNQINGTPGGVGTYQTTPTASVSEQMLYIGTHEVLQETEVTVQADVHGPNSADNSARIQTLFRDQFGVDSFSASGVDLTPLYTSDPRQIAFDNAEQQIEERWSIDLCMQANVTVITTMQFADQLKADTMPDQVFLA